MSMESMELLEHKKGLLEQCTEFQEPTRQFLEPARQFLEHCTEFQEPARQFLEDLFLNV